MRTLGAAAEEIGVARLAAEVELGLLQVQQNTVRALADDPELAEIMMKVYIEPTSLTGQESIRYIAHLGDMQATVYSAWELKRAGAISEESWERYANFHAEAYSTEWTKTAWVDQSRGMYPQDFIDDIVARSPLGRTAHSELT